MKTRLFSLIVLITSILFASCGKSDEEVVKGLAVKFYQDFQSGNFSSIKEYVVAKDEKSKAILEDMKKTMESSKATQEQLPMLDVSVTSALIHEGGKKATVKIVIAQKDETQNMERKLEQEVELEKVDGEWKLCIGGF